MGDSTGKQSPALGLGPIQVKTQQDRKKIQISLKVLPSTMVGTVIEGN